MLLFGTAELSLRLLGIPRQKDLVRKFGFPPEEMFGIAFCREPARFWCLEPGYDGPWRMNKLKYTHERHVQPNVMKSRARNYPDLEYFRTVTWGINSHGFRGEPHDSHKHVILFLGSSVTFGWGVRSDDCFPALLREKLTHEGYGGWDVVNAGVPGYSSYQSLVYLKQILDRWQPEVVIVESGINDGVQSIGLSDRQVNSAGSRSWAEKAVWSSNVALALRYAMRNRSKQPSRDVKVESERFFHTSIFAAGRSRVPEDDFRENIEEFEDLASALGAELFFMFPGLYNEYGEGELQKSVRFDHPREIRIAAAIKAGGADDLREFFLPYDEAHLSRRGHRLAADLIWSRLVQEEVFEPL
jgi:hypothetical protein